MIGTILDRKYRIVELIGSGGMAQVYKAINMGNRKTFAVKILKDEYRDDAEFLRRFSREANAILTLSHENIVRAYDSGTHNGLPYLVMEYVEGHTLKDLISKNGALPARTAIGITCQILDALHAAHAHGIIHRDVKPQNVIVTDKGRVKLADFGIAREAKASTVTFSGNKVLGSVHYISPEQAKGTIATEQSDLYSVGVCLYEMLTGTVPFEADSTVTVALMHIQEKPVPPIQLVPDLPRSLNDIVLKALEKEPENRYQTARAMRSDLVRSLSDPNGGFVNDPNDKGLKDSPRPSVYVLIAMCVFLPILLIGIFVLIYATSCRNQPSSGANAEKTSIPSTALPAPAETDSGEDSVAASYPVPDLIGYPLDDALRLLYRDYGLTNLSVAFTDSAPLYTRPNTVVAILIPSIEDTVLFESTTPVPTETPENTPVESTPEITPEPTFTPAPTGDTETVVAEESETPMIDSIAVATETPPPYPVDDVDVTPTPEPSRIPSLTLETYPYHTEIRLLVYRSSLGSCKVDINFTLNFPEDDDTPIRRVEIGFETATFEEIPYRVVLSSRLRQNEKTTGLNEAATLYWYEPVTRNMYLYVNGIAQSAPQSVTFVK
jgi:serine/threonine protein kinase